MKRRIVRIFVFAVLVTLTVCWWSSVPKAQLSYNQPNIPILTNLACYRIEENTLTDILDVIPPTEKSIYFIDSSCHSHTEGKIVITPRQACAVESAALSNTDYITYLMYTSPGLIKTENTLSNRLLQIVTNLENVEVVRLNYGRFLKNSVVEHLYTDGKIEASKFPINVASNIGRLLILYKYGGIYFDLDFVILKSLNDLPLNYAVAQSETEVNNAVLASSVNGTGHDFIKMCLDELSANFNGDGWGLNGPILVTNILKKMCGIENVKSMLNRSCSGFTIYTSEKFYPVPYQSYRSYFVDNNADGLKYVLEKSYGIHLWNKMSKDTVSNSSTSVYQTIAKKYCPRVFKEASEYF